MAGSGGGHALHHRIGIGDDGNIETEEFVPLRINVAAKILGLLALNKHERDCETSAIRSRSCPATLDLSMLKLRV